MAALSPSLWVGFIFEAKAWPEWVGGNSRCAIKTSSFLAPVGYLDHSEEEEEFNTVRENQLLLHSKNLFLLWCGYIIK